MGKDDITISKMMDNSPIDSQFWEGGYDIAANMSRPAKTKPDPVRPFISTKDAWANYSNDFVYTFDAAIREWIDTMAEVRQWKLNWRDRRYDLAAIWWCVMGTEPLEDELYVHNRQSASHLAAYYSSSVKNGYKNAKWARAKSPKKMYIISPARARKAPYSLRLRIEWLTEQGIDLTFDNMAVPKDDLKCGHSRNPLTEKAIQRRHEDALKRYNEKWGADVYAKKHQKQER